MTTEITALGEREILGLAISLEAEDVRIYDDLAEKLRDHFPKLAAILESMGHSVTVNRAPLRHVGGWARAGRFPSEAVVLLQGNHTV
ncbi:MAG: hypothetical protein JO232_22670 [Verrucomicrobia bacterium]|nr:hypothetical protein [Verrucomicrobiota bacterium]